MSISDIAMNKCSNGQLMQQLLTYLKISALVFFSSGDFSLAADLNEYCTVSVLNRNVQVKPDGTWVLPNIPANLGLVRARATCTEDGITRTGQSAPFLISANGSVDVPNIELTNTLAIPTNLTVTALSTTLNTPAATIQLTVTGTFGASAPKDLTNASAGTIYNISNSDIATVTPDGLITAVTSGRVVVQAINEGTAGLLTLSRSRSPTELIPTTTVSPMTKNYALA